MGQRFSDEEAIFLLKSLPNNPGAHILFRRGAGEGADLSACDFSLLAALKQITGGEPDQMERLFLQSVLGKRDKAKRPDYLKRTIDRVLGDISIAPMDEVFLRGLLSPVASVVAVDGIPENPKELLHLPWKLGSIQDYVFNRMPYPCRATAGLVALSAMSVILQKKFVIQSQKGLGFNEFYMVLAPTGFGKESLRGAVLDLMRAGVDRCRISREEVTALHHAAPSSAQGLHRLLEGNASIGLLADEFSIWLAQTRAGGYREETLKYAMECYGRAMGSIHPGHTASKENPYETVNHPRLSLFCTGTKEKLIEGLTGEQGQTGAYNRFLIFIGDRELPPKRYDGLIFEPEDGLVAFVADLLRRDPEKGVVRFSKEGWESYKTVDQKTAERVRRKDAVLGGRLGEQAIKIAGMIAVADGRMEIGADDIETAYAIRMGLYHRAAAIVKDEGNIGDLHPTMAAAEQIIGVLKKHPWLYRSALGKHSRRYKTLSPRCQKDVVDLLLRDGYCDATGKKLISCIHK
ncbi:DUF3987 domain-containing protein [Desulfobotulus sp. H1]|uniref:DUF3987 domain-containing protein n=1 Tax=Desulfobotulus pelophilus TaxID=2823377 RepID=A0ABT3N5K2_9BACT|nr:DUF3987 domain-containing protein [Desulfobotulus pelophilus]MCW7752735.1 DUF3987 domain-containing protein [Desulfobotulus pelophilus]